MVHRSRYHGVYWDSDREKWRAIIRLDNGRGALIQLGVYADEEQAMQVREAYIRQQNISDVRRNFPNKDCA